MVATRLAATVAAALALPGAASAMVDGAAPVVAPPAVRPAAAPLPAPLRPVFVVTGHGWGHGIGMGQYGAYGYAQHGWDYKRILAHYYPGTVLGDAPVAKVRVLLASGSSALTVGATGPLRVVDAKGKAWRLPAGELSADHRAEAEAPGAKKAKPLPGPLVFTPLAGPFELGGVPYRGSVQIAVVGGALQAVNSLGIDCTCRASCRGRCLRGGLPRRSRRRPSSPARTRSRTSTAAHSTSTRTRAARSTAASAPSGRARTRPCSRPGQVVLYDGVVAQTFFFSTSGGRTAAIQDAWPKAEPLPTSSPCRTPTTRSRRTTTGARCP